MYKLNEAKMFYDIADGQAVVINFETGMYYGSSPLASAILDLLLKVTAELFGSCASSYRVGENVHLFKADFLYKSEAFIEILLVFTGKAYHHVSGKGAVLKYLT